MIYLGWFLLIFGLIRLTVSLVNYLSRPCLPSSQAAAKPSERVSVLIPARNEEANIANLLGDLERSAGVLEIIVYDDDSTDGTSGVVESFAERDPKITLIRGGEIPEGWLGKNNACDNLARRAKGNFYLFLDADVRISPGAVAEAAQMAEERQIRLLSLFPQQEMPDYGTTLAVPLMNWILLSLLPLVAVEKAPYVSLSAANGQFMFIDAEAYNSIKPHSLFRGSAVEDMATVKEFKRRGLHVATLLGRGDVKCRMYGNLDEAVQGFSKNIFHFFGGSALLCFLFVIATTLAPIVIFIFNGWILGLIYLAIIFLIRIFVSLASNQSVATNLLRMIPQQITLWRISLSAWKTRKNRNLQWKGRKIY